MQQSRLNAWISDVNRPMSEFCNNGERSIWSALRLNHGQRRGLAFLEICAWAADYPSSSLHRGHQVASAAITAMIAYAVHTVCIVVRIIVGHASWLASPPICAAA